GPRCDTTKDCTSPATCGARPVTAPLFNEQYFLDSDTLTVMLAISEAVGGGRTRESSHMFAGNQDVVSSLYTRFGAAPFAVKNQLMADIGFSQNITSGHGQESSHATSSSQSFALQKMCFNPAPIPCVDADQAYGAAVAYYYSADGTQKVVQAVDLTASQSGSGFWTTHYAGHPDPALNLPQRMVITADGPHWNPNAAHQLIRGFAVLHAPSSAMAVENGVPISRPITVGDKVQLSVRVYNYSLDTPANNLEVSFFAVQIDPSDQSLLKKPPIPLCQVGASCPRVTSLAGRATIAVQLL